mgnify:CR=1 FL=1
MAFTGNFDEKYFPEVLFSSKLEPLLNDRRYCKSIEDKSLIPIGIVALKNFTSQEQSFLVAHLFIMMGIIIS